MLFTFSILFYPRGNDIDKDGNAPIYARSLFLWTSGL